MRIKIGDYARIRGVHKDTIRRWEREGRLTPSYVEPNGTRWYDAPDIRPSADTAPAEEAREDSKTIFLRWRLDCLTMLEALRLHIANMPDTPQAQLNVTETLHKVTIPGMADDDTIASLFADPTSKVPRT